MTLADHFSETGVLSKTLDDFSSRPQQQEMADRVAHTIEQGGVLVTEAATGVGKTFAYLVPAILSGKRIIIATGTKNLQDQLFHKDLPLVRKALAAPVTTALLKGRANYLCTHRLMIHLQSGHASRRHQHDLELIKDWAGRTQRGDVAEVDEVEEGSFVWPLVTSTAENCLGQACDDYAECYVVKARREAQAADLVIINHHLFFADMALKEQGFGDILSAADVFILDEAHQLAEIASNFFGYSVTSRQLYNLASDIQKEHIRACGALDELPDALGRMERTAADLRLSMGGAGRRLAWRELDGNARFHDYLLVLKNDLEELSNWLAAAAERGKGLDNCHKRCLSLLERVNMMTDQDTEPGTEIATAEDSDGKADDDIDTGIDKVRWVEISRRGFGLHSTPLDIAGIFQANMQEMNAAWVFTSATLAVTDRFEHFTQRLGLEAPETQALGSPFDFKNNALLYLPKGFLQPADPAYTGEVCNRALPVIEAARGRTFVLFTSHRALKIAAEFIADHVNYPVLVQGAAPKQRLLKDFRAHGNAILLGTASFWEGVDVRGSALSCVIIDKLPFASPGDPVLQARLEAMKKQGKTPFFDYQLPHAVVTLKQGVGRLIRDVKDTGVLMLCDPRLTSKSYGKVFLDSLPDMPITHELADVQKFFEIRLSA